MNLKRRLTEHVKGLCRKIIRDSVAHEHEYFDTVWDAFWYAVDCETVEELTSVDLEPVLQNPIFDLGAIGQQESQVLDSLYVLGTCAFAAASLMESQARGEIVTSDIREALKIQTKRMRVPQHIHTILDKYAVGLFAELYEASDWGDASSNLDRGLEGEPIQETRLHVAFLQNVVRIRDFPDALPLNNEFRVLEYCVWKNESMTAAEGLLVFPKWSKELPRDPFHQFAKYVSNCQHQSKGYKWRQFGIETRFEKDKQGGYLGPVWRLVMHNFRSNISQSRAHYNSANDLYMAGDIQNAIDELSKGMELYGKCLDSHILLARCCTNDAQVLFDSLPQEIKENIVRSFIYLDTFRKRIDEGDELLEKSVDIPGHAGFKSDWLLVKHSQRCINSVKYAETLDSIIKGEAFSDDEVGVIGLIRILNKLVNATESKERMQALSEFLKSKIMEGFLDEHPDTKVLFQRFQMYQSDTFLRFVDMANSKVTLDIGGFKEKLYACTSEICNELYLKNI